MRDLTTLRIDLGINAQQIAQQVMIENKHIEKQIAEGIQLALDELSNEDNFVQMIKEGTKNEIQRIIKQSVCSWELKSKIEKAVTEKMGEKINSYAENVADKILKNL